MGIWRLRLYQGKRLNMADFGMTLNVQKLQENQGELKVILKLWTLKRFKTYSMQ